MQWFYLGKQCVPVDRIMYFYIEHGVKYQRCFVLNLKSSSSIKMFIGISDDKKWDIMNDKNKKDNN